MVDATRLKESWAIVAQSGDQVPLFFYSSLFLAHPDLREMFPTSMAGQRDRLVGTLGHTVSHVDKLDALVPFLQELGVDHRKFAVTAEQYPLVGAALLATLAHFLGDHWTDELARDWGDAYRTVAEVMTLAAAESARHSPPWWTAEVIVHERRTLDVAVLQLRPDGVVPFVAGQSVAVESPLRPRVWRFYSPANAPRRDGTIELHVRLMDGGLLSSTLVQGLSVGDVLRLGPPLGDALTVHPSARDDLLLIAGGTGLAPLKALVEQVAADGDGRQVSLYMGARHTRDLYDMDAMSRLAHSYGWLKVLPVTGETPVEAALRDEMWQKRDIYICGSEAMVRDTTASFVRAGRPEGEVHYEPTSNERYATLGRGRNQ